MAGGQILEIAEHSIGAGRCELQIDGELDLWSVERLQAVFQRASRDRKGGRLVLYGCSERVLRVFTDAGLTDAGIVFDSRGEAIAELAAVK